MRHLFVLLLSLIWTFPASAVIHGSAANPVAVSTGKITVDQLRWHASVKGLITETNECSSVVVGTAPLTVLTAAHCMRNARLNPVTKTPMVQLFLGVPVPQLRAAVYSDYDNLDENLARDIAVLIFDGNAPEGIEALPVTTAHSSPKALLCGYGQGYRSAVKTEPSCAVKNLMTANEEFQHFVPAIYEPMDPLLYMQFRTQFEAKKLLLRSQNALLAVNRLHQNEYRTSLPMPTRGDSGGPWMINLPGPKRGVVALTSFVETFYRKNKQWPFFKQTRAPLSDFPYVAYGVRLDTDEARSLFSEARLLGADIDTWQ